MTQWGLDTLFNPAKRHMDDEKRRLQSTREEVGDNSGGNRINLESGKVTIRKPDGDEVADVETADSPPAKAGKAAKAAADETPAQARARARREAARKPKK